MARFLPLTVREVRRETRDAVVLTLEPRAEDRAAFAFREGQYLTFRHAVDGEELRRSYSICSGVGDPDLRVAVKRVEGGAFSTWANTGLRAGDTLEAIPPQGRFHAPPGEGARHHLAFAAGSGITPVLSIVRTVLAREPGSFVTLVYANRQAGTIMFREELEDLKNSHLGRLSILHILGAEGAEIELFGGRLDEAKLAALFRLWIDPSSVDVAYVCGPEPLMLVIARSLRAHGVPEEAIRFELFASGQPRTRPSPAKAEAGASTGGTVEVSLTIDGTTRRFAMPAEGQSLLEAGLAHDLDLPWSCRAGVCSTCRARLTDGEAEMRANHALEDHEVRDGFVLTCQAHPTSARIALTFDE